MNEVSEQCRGHVNKVFHAVGGGQPEPDIGVHAVRTKVTWWRVTRPAPTLGMCMVSCFVCTWNDFPSFGKNLCMLSSPLLVAAHSRSSLPTEAG